MFSVLQHCTLELGCYTKDLSIVNEDLSSVFILDNSPGAYRYNPGKVFLDDACVYFSQFYCLFVCLFFCGATGTSEKAGLKNSKQNGDSNLDLSDAGVVH